MNASTVRSATPRSAPARTPRAAVLRSLAPPFVGGHLYAGARGVAVVLGAQAIACAAIAWGHPPFWAALPFVILGDAAGAAGRVAAERAGRPVGLGVRALPALGVVALGILAALPRVAPDVVAGSSLRAACAFAADCEGGEAFVDCVRRAADATYAGDAPSAADAEACATCLHGATCERAREACARCEGLVSLPEPPPVVLPPGPIGTAPSDLQMVIPSLVPREPSAPTELTAEELLEALEDLPPLPPPAGAPTSPELPAPTAP